MEQAFPILMQQNKGDLDVVELCGGEGRTSQLALRKKWRTGQHFDLVTGCDLNEPAVQRDVVKYFWTKTIFISK